MSEENEISIDRIELGTGWACFRAGKKNPAPEMLPTSAIRMKTRRSDNSIIGRVFHIWNVVSIFLDLL